jgi:hypothetical protein
MSWITRLRPDDQIVVGDTKIKNISKRPVDLAIDSPHKIVKSPRVKEPEPKPKIPEPFNIFVGCIICGKEVENTPRLIRVCDACLKADPALGWAP